MGVGSFTGDFVARLNKPYTPFFLPNQNYVTLSVHSVHLKRQVNFNPNLSPSGRIPFGCMLCIVSAFRPCTLADCTSRTESAAALKLPNMREDLKLTAGAVDVWQIVLSVHEDQIPCCRRLLSEVEIQRANRFHFEKDKNDFMVARSATRKILSQYLNTDPQELTFSYTARGKPEFAPGFPGASIKFNLSHSRGFALLAVAQSLCVGIDIQFIDPELSVDGIATRFFSRTEINTLRTLSPIEKTKAFFDCWTRKEAYIKALGEGLSLQLDSFDVAFGPGVPAALLRADVSPQEPSRWSMYDIAVRRGYAAALVVEGKAHRLRQARWESQF